MLEYVHSPVDYNSIIIINLGMTEEFCKSSEELNWPGTYSRCFDSEVFLKFSWTALNEERECVALCSVVLECHLVPSTSDLRVWVLLLPPFILGTLGCSHQNYRHLVGLPGRVIHKTRGQTPMPLVAFEPVIPVFERAKEFHGLQRFRDNCDRPMKDSKDRARICIKVSI
jgi:hypothetical protein